MYALFGVNPYVRLADEILDKVNDRSRRGIATSADVAVCGWLFCGNIFMAGAVQHAFAK